MRITLNVLKEDANDLNQRVGHTAFTVDTRNGYTVVEDRRGQPRQLSSITTNKEAYAYMLGVSDGLDEAPILLTPVRKDSGNCRLYVRSEKFGNFVILDQGHRANPRYELFTHSRDGEPDCPVFEGRKWVLVANLEDYL